MSEELVNKIKDKINNNEINMKPHYYFILGSIAVFFGMLGSIALSTISTTALFYRARMNQGFGCDLAYNGTPWVLLFLTLGFFALAVYLFEKYDISYKVSMILIGSLIGLTVLLSGFVIDRRDMHRGFRQMPMMNQFFEGTGYGKGYRKNNNDYQNYNYEGRGSGMMQQKLRDGSGEGLRLNSIRNNENQSKPMMRFINTKNCGL